jgi:uncharacterized membrane protein YhaH (DUF805 family)
MYDNFFDKSNNMFFVLIYKIILFIILFIIGIKIISSNRDLNFIINIISFIIILYLIFSDLTTISELSKRYSSSELYSKLVKFIQKKLT